MALLEDDGNVDFEKFAREFLSMAEGNPGTIITGKEMDDSGCMRLQELLGIMRARNLRGNSLYVLHKEFASNDLCTTAVILRRLHKDADLEARLPRTSALVPILSYLQSQM